MQLKELMEQLRHLPDDAEVTYGKYQGFYNANREECIIISRGNKDYFIDIPRYEGLPGEEVEVENTRLRRKE